MTAFLRVLACALALAAVPASARMNALHVIAPYKHHGLWVFDDERVGLSREPFVAGADTMIDKAVAGIAGAERGFVLVFSQAPFPGHTIKLEWRRNDGGGDWYYARELEQEGWLCPALLKYFERAPREIYVQVRPKAQ